MMCSSFASWQRLKKVAQPKLLFGGLAKSSFQFFNEDVGAMPRCPRRQQHTEQEGRLHVQPETEPAGRQLA